MSFRVEYALIQKIALSCSPLTIRYMRLVPYHNDGVVAEPGHSMGYSKFRRLTRGKRLRKASIAAVANMALSVGSGTDVMKERAYASPNSA